MRPVFSIIIPCYKVEAYIRACLDSVLAQTCPDWEAICTDDGSPDNTGKILDEYAAKDPRIKVVHQANGGLSAARNAAMAQATGEWFLYLDSDDLLAPWALETYSRIIFAAPQADMIRAEMSTFVDGEQPNWRKPEFYFEVTGTSTCLDYKFCTGYFQRFIYRRAAYDELRFVGMSWCEERPYFAKCYSRAKCVAETKTPCYGFRVRKGSITQGKMTIDQWKACLDVTHEVLQIYRDSGKVIDAQIPRRYIICMLEDHIDMIYALLPKKDHGEAWKTWFGQLPTIARLPGKTEWLTFVVNVCRLVPLKIVALLLCYVPHWLKKKGLHR